MPDDIRKIICPKWSLEILQFLAEDSPQNYSQIETEFDTSSDVVVERLQLLVNAGLLARNEKSSKDVQYSTTADGEELVDLLEEVNSHIFNG